MKAKSGRTKRKYGSRDGSSSVMRVVITLFFVILFVVVATMYIRQQATFHRISNRSEDLTEEAALVSEENEEAKDLQSKVGTDEYTEELARDQLGMVKIGETIYDEEAD